MLFVQVLQVTGKTTLQYRPIHSLPSQEILSTVKTLLESRRFQLRTEYQLINKEPELEVSNFLSKYGIFRTCLGLMYHELNSGKLFFLFKLLDNSADFF